jgi:hypothetical protein
MKLTFEKNLRHVAGSMIFLMGNCHGVRIIAENECHLYFEKE